MNNGRPLGKKKTVQLLILLTVLAWATQTLIHQWGFGDETDATPDAANAPAAINAPAPAPAPDPDAVGPEQFVSGGSSEAVVAATLELKSEATIVGSDVKLKQVCRWNTTDDTILAPIADLTVYHIDGPTPFHSLSVDDIRQTLHDAGINLATINFVGAASCTVTRSDVQTDPQSALAIGSIPVNPPVARRSRLPTPKPPIPLRPQRPRPRSFHLPRPSPQPSIQP